MKTAKREQQMLNHFPTNTKKQAGLFSNSGKLENGIQ